MNEEITRKGEEWYTRNYAREWGGLVGKKGIMSRKEKNRW